MVDMSDNANTGSSPHVRGAHGRRGFPDNPQGIIPACAGSTGPRTCAATRRRDHPRMCGEHISGFLKGLKQKGSSPHVRGARAGGRGCKQSGWDHPRMCGEHPPLERLRGCRPGSSPHVRGALRFQAWSRFCLGIIPACAGSTTLTARGWTATEGSSPHVRGALQI